MDCPNYILRRRRRTGARLPFQAARRDGLGGGVKNFVGVSLSTFMKERRGVVMTSMQSRKPCEVLKTDMKESVEKLASVAPLEARETTPAKPPECRPSRFSTLPWISSAYLLKTEKASSSTHDQKYSIDCATSQAHWRCPVTNSSRITKSTWSSIARVAPAKTATWCRRPRCGSVTRKSPFLPMAGTHGSHRDFQRNAQEKIFQ